MYFDSIMKNRINVWYFDVLLEDYDEVQPNRVKSGK